MLGGSDGFNVGRPTLLGQKLPDSHSSYILFVVSVVLSTVMALLARIYFDSTRGLVTLAVRENELRVEYLGGSVRQAMTINFILAAFCGGMGGALAVLALGHIEPELQLLDHLGRVRLRRDPGRLAERGRGVRRQRRARGGAQRSRVLYFPNTWQLVLGLFLLFVIRFLPQGHRLAVDPRARAAAGHPRR